MIEIKANEQIYGKWMELKTKLTTIGEFAGLLASIVQNDMKIEDDEIFEWGDQIDKLANDIDTAKGELFDLANETFVYVKP